jgi:hypothetical protein
MATEEQLVGLLGLELGAGRERIQSMSRGAGGAGWSRSRSI